MEQPSFSGLMPEGTKALAISVTATDKNSLSASETFVAAIAQDGGNDFALGRKLKRKYIDLVAVAARPYNEPCTARALSTGSSFAEHVRFDPLSKTLDDVLTQQIT